MPTTVFDRHTADLRALNTLTKYPSIPTYHELDPKNGCLLDNPTVFYRDGYTKLDGPVIGTEKIDGTNARIILLPPDDGGYLLGSREHLLYANGDLIGDPAQGIVEHLRPVADNLTLVGADDALLVCYLELYGGKIGSHARQYTTRGAVGWRLFDVATVGDLSEKMTWEPARAAGWRDGGGQEFADEATLRILAQTTGLALTPRLFTLDASDIPASIYDMQGFLTSWLPETQAALDDTAHRGGEGIVLRTPDRSVIAKARFQDYERTLRRRVAGGPRCDPS